MSLADEFEHWSKESPPDLFGDPIWRLPAYRIGLFLSVVCRGDRSLAQARPADAYAFDQLTRSVDSIAANIAEGYSRFSGRERARYYEMALGSAREAREWYRSLRPAIGDERAYERAMLLTRAIKVLTRAVPEERAGATERRLWNRRGKDEKKG